MNSHNINKNFLVVIWAVFASIFFSFGCACGQNQTAYVHEETFSNEHNLTGLMSSFTEYFHTGNWKIEKGQLTLVYSSTPLVRPDVSDFTISLNGTRVYSQKIPESSGEIKQETIDLPAYAIRNGVNSITFESYVRTSESSNICEDDISNATWLNLMKDSSVSVQYVPKAEIKSASDLYDQFTSVDALENKQSAVLVASDPTADEITAAGFVLAGISKNATMNYGNIQFGKLDDFNLLSNYKYSIYIADYDKLDTLVKLQLTDEQKEKAEKQAIIAAVKLDTGNYVLTVTGKNMKALANAGRLFGNQALFQQTITSWREVTDSDDVMMPKTSQAHQEILTANGTYLHGPFRQAATFYINNQANQLLSPDSNITISYRHSENLDFDRSLITVYVADIPIGSKKLTKSTAQGDEITFSVPNDISVSGNLSITVAFDLEIKDLQCTVRQEQMPWAYIAPSSFANLITKQSPYLLFDYYPSPFILNDMLNNVVFIIPYNYSKTDLDTYGAMMLELGRNASSNRGTFRMAYSNNIGDLSNANIIAIGRYQKNPIAQQLNAQLFFEFSPEGTTILSNEKTRIDANYGSTLGNIELLYSPYSSDQHALLLVSAVQDQGITNSIYYLSSEHGLWETNGDGCLIDSDTINCYKFKADNAKSKTLRGILSSHTELFRFSLIAGSVIILLLIAIGFLWGRYINKNRS